MKGITASQVKKMMAAFFFTLLISIGVCSHNECKSYDFTQLYGRYCPAEGNIIGPVPWHQCKLYCLHTSSCQSLNYNFADNVCTYFTATCPKAISHPTMALGLFTGKDREQCIEWIPKQEGHPSRDSRSVTEDNRRFLARMQKNGSDFTSYLLGFPCYSRDDNGATISNNGYPCQYLRVRYGCTVYYVTYELGATLPPNALVAGYTAGGLPVYIGIEERAVRPEYYIPGSNRLVANWCIYTDNVKLLVSL